MRSEDQHRFGHGGGEPAQRMEEERRQARERELEQARLAGAAMGAGEPDRSSSPLQRQEDKIGRNAPCPCGSGKKFKLCHGRNPNAA